MIKSIMPGRGAKSRLTASPCSKIIIFALMLFALFSIPRPSAATSPERWIQIDYDNSYILPDNDYNGRIQYIIYRNADKGVVLFYGENSVQRLKDGDFKKFDLEYKPVDISFKTNIVPEPVYQTQISPDKNLLAFSDGAGKSFLYNSDGDQLSEFPFKYPGIVWNKEGSDIQFVSETVCNRISMDTARYDPTGLWINEGGHSFKRLAPDNIVFDFDGYAGENANFTVFDGSSIPCPLLKCAYDFGSSRLALSPSDPSQKTVSINNFKGGSIHGNRVITYKNYIFTPYARYGMDGKSRLPFKNAYSIIGTYKNYIYFFDNNRNIRSLNMENCKEGKKVLGTAVGNDGFVEGSRLYYFGYYGHNDEYCVLDLNTGKTSIIPFGSFDEAKNRLGSYTKEFRLDGGYKLRISKVLFTDDISWIEDPDGSCTAVFKGPVVISGDYVYYTKEIRDAESGSGTLSVCRMKIYDAVEIPIVQKLDYPIYNLELVGNRLLIDKSGYFSQDSLYTCSLDGGDLRPLYQAP